MPGTGGVVQCAFPSGAAVTRRERQAGRELDLVCQLLEEETTGEVEAPSPSVTPITAVPVCGRSLLGRCHEHPVTPADRQDPCGLMTTEGGHSNVCSMSRLLYYSGATGKNTSCCQREQITLKKK